MKKYLTINSDSEKETRHLASIFAEELGKTLFESGATIVSLKGDLGAGKTTFVLGFLGYFGIKPHAASPTFVIMKRYVPKATVESKKSKVESIYHLDAYRLRSKKDLDILGFEEISKNPKNVILIEWPEMLKGKKFKNKISITFSYGRKENERKILFWK